MGTYSKPCDLMCVGLEPAVDGEDTSEEYQLRYMKPAKSREILDVNWLVSGFSFDIEQE